MITGVKTFGNIVIFWTIYLIDPIMPEYRKANSFQSDIKNLNKLTPRAGRNDQKGF